MRKGRAPGSGLHLVVDAVAARPGSATIVIEHLLRGWTDAFPEDRITLLTGPDGAAIALPPGVRARAATPPVGGRVGQVWLRAYAARRAARELGADAVLAGVPASNLLGSRCPRGVILYDLRHELRPHQFSRASRVARRVSWGWSLRRADKIFTISDRTLDDLVRRHPRLADRGVSAQLGSDHVDHWAPDADRPDAPYALAFGHFSNKNADAVLAGWARFCAEDPTWRLRVVGMGRSDREAATALVAELGIGDRVDLMPWLDDEAFRRCFRGAGLVIFPSDFEGFGLPAVEAMRLGIPVVVSHDAALAEVTGGLAAAATPDDPADLAAAIRRALATSDDDLKEAARFTDSFTWARTASVIRAGLAPEEYR